MSYDEEWDDWDVQEDAVNMLRCRCTGVDRRTPCVDDASQEDGLCDGCRCVHGCCADHGDMGPEGYMTGDIETWMDQFHEAFEKLRECRRQAAVVRGQK